MTRESGRNDRRSQIAHFAARLMTEDGIEDYALAKRKAARQVGVPDTRELPTNEEIDAALKTYQEIYHRDEHRSRLHELRRIAVRAMRRLAQFNPYLTGSVLNGNASKYADIHLQLFTDNVKAVEHYLIDHDISYQATQMRLYAGTALQTVPLYIIDDEGTQVELAVLTTRELRGPLKTSLEGKNIERAKLEAVESLLAAT